MVHQYSFSGEVLDKAVFLVLVASMNRARITMLTPGTMVLTVWGTLPTRCSIEIMNTGAQGTMDSSSNRTHTRTIFTISSSITSPITAWTNLWTTVWTCHMTEVTSPGYNKLQEMIQASGTLTVTRVSGQLWEVHRVHMVPRYRCHHLNLATVRRCHLKCLLNQDPGNKSISEYIFFAIKTFNEWWFSINIMS